MKKPIAITLFLSLIVLLNIAFAGDNVLYNWEGTTTEGWVDYGWGTAATVTMSASQERAFFGMGALKLDAVIPEADKLDMGEDFAPDVKYDFEADLQGWSNFPWGQIQVNLSHSSTQVFAGSYSLAAAGTLAVEGDKWEIGKTANMDLSEFGIIRAQVYIPDPEGLQAKLFAQVGSGWTYMSGGDIMVPVVGWNEIYWDISEMENREFKSLGVQIYCNGGNSVTFNDTVWVDQVECLKYDLTGAKWITMDIYAPEDFHGGGKIFAQTGSGWTWNDAGWFDAPPGWSTWFWNVEDLDLSPSSLKRIGAEIYADSAVTGIFYLDNFKVCDEEPTFKKYSKITTLFDFEVNTSAFISLNWGQQPVTLDTSHLYAVDGVSSLSATGVLTAEGDKWEFACGATLDLSLYNYARALVYVTDPEVVELKLFAQDAEWTYVDGAPNKFPVEGWNQIWWDISEVDRAAIHNFGVQVYATDASNLTIVYVDHIQLSEEILEQEFIPAEGPKVLYTFEDDLEGFAEFTEFGGGTIDGIDTTRLDSRDGIKSLVVQTSVQKTHVGKVYPLGSELDLVNYAYLECWVYFPDDFPDWQGGKLIGKFGGEEVASGWHGTNQNQGQWHLIGWDISSLPGRANISMLGVEVWGASSSGNDILIDHYVAYPAKPAGDEMTVVSIDFDTGIEGWVSLPWGQLPADLTTSVEHIWTGDSSLSISGTFTGVEGEKLEVASGQTFNFTIGDTVPATMAWAHVFIPDPTGLQVKLFGQFGSGWTYLGGGDILVPVPGWNEIAWELTDIPLEDLTVVHNFGLQVYSNGCTYDGPIFLDGIRVAVQEIPEAPEPPIGNVPMVTLFGFEDATGDPVSYDWNGIVATEMVLSDEEAWEGINALKVTATFSASAGLNIGWGMGVDSSMTNYNFITARVYVPDATGLGGKVWGKWGADSSWGEGPYVGFVNGWNVLNLNVNSQDVPVAHELGINIWSGSSTYSGPIYIDYITGSRYEAAGFIPVLPEIEHTVLNDFESEDDFFTWVSGNEQVDMFLSPEIVGNGYSALQVMVNFEDGVYGSGKFGIIDTATYEFSVADSFAFWAYYPGTGIEGEFMSANIYLQDNTWTWRQASWQPFYPGEWTRIVFPIPTSWPPMWLAETHMIGVQLSNMENSQTITEYEGPIFVDNFIMYAPAVPITIAEATVDADEDFVPDMLGETVFIEGIVTTPNFGSHTQYWIQDATAGIQLYSGSMDLDYTIGDLVSVIGEIDQYNGINEIIPDSIKVVSSGNDFDTTVVTIAEIGESIEGRIVKVNAVRLIDSSQWPAEGSNGNVDITDGVDTIYIFVDKDTDQDGWTPPDVFNITAVVDQYTSSTPPDNGYSLRSRFQTDVQSISFTIAEAKTDIDEDFVPDRLGEVVEVKGVITTPNFGSHTQYWMQDETAGIQLYSGSMDLEFAVGDHISVIGEIDQYNGITEIVPMNIDLIATGVDFDTTVVKIADLGEDIEGIIVEIDSVWLINPSQWPSSGSNGNVDITDGVDTTYIFVDKDTDLDGWTPPISFNVIAVIDQYSSADPPNDGYSLRTRYQTDITFVELGIDPNSFLPTEFSLAQNFPNPFNPTTTIKYDLAKDVDVKLTIYNILGQEIATLVQSKQTRGYYSLIWDGKNNNGEMVGSGIYFYHLVAGDYTALKKLTLIK